MSRLNKTTFRKAVIGSHGVQTVIAQKLGVGRSLVSQFVKKYPDMRKLLEEQENSILDLAENKLYSAVNKGDMRAIAMVLERKGKNRGWGKEPDVQITQNNDNRQLSITTPIRVVRVDKKEDLLLEEGSDGGD